MLSIIGSIYLREFSFDRESALTHSKNFATNSSYFQINNCTNNINNDFVQCLKNISAVELNTAQQLFSGPARTFTRPWAMFNPRGQKIKSKQLKCFVLYILTYKYYIVLHINE